MTAFRRTQLIRLGVWIGLATVAVLTTVLAARTETGIRRIATLLTPPSRPGPRPRSSPTRRSRSKGSRAAPPQRRDARALRPTATGLRRGSTRSSAVSMT